MAGNQAKQPRPNVKWSKTQSVNGDILTIVSSPERIFASFDSSANFNATPKNNSDLADFLLTIATYSPKLSPDDVRATSTIPGNIKLLPGYKHKHRQGIDTWTGTIEKTNGLGIDYDIGSLAGNYALGSFEREKNKVVWFKKQYINNLELMVTYLNDGALEATFPATCANFIASKVTADEDIADFLTMIVTYRERVEIKAKPTPWDGGC
jgi:hypothetical protein